MIIHLEVDWDDAILERFALIIAQQSLHFALQLNWILQGAIEDYEPELPSGEANPGYNPLYYVRCVKLLQNIERIVVYGRPRSIELQRLVESGQITKEEYQIMELQDRRFNALQIADAGKKTSYETYGGELLYKRKIRESCFRPKPWNTRYFAIEDRMLNCYTEKHSVLERSMPLEGAKTGEHLGKYPYMFFVENRGFHFIIRAKSEDDKGKWLKALGEESKAKSLFTRELTQTQLSELEKLTPEQRSRYDFFNDERNFVRDVCDLAERLRFKERDERKKLAPTYMEEIEIPPKVYVPLCNSTDIWRRVHKAVSKDVKVFNTNERCPVIMNFIAKRGENMSHSNRGMRDVNLDVATYLHLEFDMDVDGKNMEVIEEENGEMTSAPSAEDLGAVGSGSGMGNGEGVEVIRDDMTDSAHHSVWHETSPSTQNGSNSTQTPQGKGNAFLRDNLGGLPRNLAKRLSFRRTGAKKAASSSALNKATSPIESVPIIDNARGRDVESDSQDDGSVVSVEHGTVMVAKDEILPGDQQRGDITVESITRATQVLTGGENWAQKSERMLKENVPDGESGICEITSLMAKSNDDLRQEVFVMQMIHYYKSVFVNAGLPLWLKTYRILSISKDTGLIEVLTDASSIDGLKKSDGFPKEGGLRAYFEATYGDPSTKSFKAAQANFIHSLAAYSIVSYLLGLKDRHNGNIMIDTRGHLIFIDFGFAMGMAPGHEFSFERAPFKLTMEYVDLMGGLQSDGFREFERLFVAGFEAARKNSLIALGLVEIMMYKSNYPCFTGFRYGNGIALKKFEQRLMLNVPDSQIKKRAAGLVK